MRIQLPRQSSRKHTGERRDRDWPARHLVRGDMRGDRAWMNRIKAARRAWLVDVMYSLSHRDVAVLPVSRVARKNGSRLRAAGARKF